MLIAIDKGLEGIKKELMYKGYQVVYYDEYNHPVDAYIYSNRSEGIFNEKAILHSVLTNVNHGTEKLFNGAILINSYNKCFEQIEKELQKQHFHLNEFY